MKWLEDEHFVTRLACSRRSDSGEQCKVKGSANPHLSPQSPSTFHRFLYSTPLSTIWTLGTGYHQTCEQGDKEMSVSVWSIKENVSMDLDEQLEQPTSMESQRKWLKNGKDQLLLSVL